MWPLRLHNLRTAVFVIFSITSFTPFKQGKSKNTCSKFIFIGIVTWHCGVIILHRFNCLLNLYICWLTNNYLNMKTEICQFIIFTCFIQHALSKITILPIHYVFNIQRWRLPFCLHLNLGITWSLQSARMTESPVFLNKETHS